MKGRKPTPSAIKALRGTLAPGIEPTPQAGAPDEPNHIKDDPIAHTEWETTCKHLESMGLLATTDRAILELYCRAYSDWRRAIEMVAKYGDVVYADKGKTVIRESPYTTHRKAAYSQCLDLLRELGLTAVARTRLRTTTKKNDANPWAGLLN
jgi:P27 family predicted phage terminase small subunit